MPADPSALGRGIVVGPGGNTPPGFATAPRVVVDDGTLRAPDATVALLHDLWLRRQPVVVELAVDPGELRAPGHDGREPWEVGAGFEFTVERLQFLVWANNWDARRGDPIWWWARKASRLGAIERGPADAVPADVVPADVFLAGGQPAFVDGGPRGAIDLDHPSLAGCVVVHRESVEAGVLATMRHAEPEAVLATDQLAAVAHRGGAARIIAPAGSGKTRVLTERLRHLLADRQWEPASVTAVAFNKRAADELVSRTSGLRTHVRTINALGLAVLTGQLGGPPPRVRPTVIDEPEVRRILDGLVDVRRQANTDVLAPFIEGLGAIRIGLRDPAEVEAELPDAVGLTAVWPAYRDALRARNAVDFDDQVEVAIRVLLTRPDVRAEAQRRCRHLLCDEFQDLAPAHLLLLRLLAAPTYDVFGVGDDDQVIYGYAGATPSYLIDFERWFPGARGHALEINYRCPVAVVDGARRLLAYNDSRIAKTIRSPQGAAAGSLQIRPVAAADMAGVAVEEVARALAGGHAPSDIAVLARVNSALLPVQIALGVADVTTTRPLDRRVLERTGVRTALAWLRLGADPGSITRADVAETIRRPSRRISRNVAEMVTKRARTSSHEIRRLAAKLSGGDVEKLLTYAADIDAVARAVPRGTAAALAAIRTTVGLGRAMDSLDASRAEADRSTHGDDLRALEQVAALHPDAATFGEWLASELDRRAPLDGPAVTLSTIHRVKGQEWPVVVVYGAHDEAFPHRLATDVEEERRVFHVAITRASVEAVVLTDDAHPSPFAAEVTGARPRVPLRGRLVAATSLPLDGARATVAGNRSGVAAARASVTDPEPDDATWDALRRWRVEVAARDGVPAFVVMSNKHLKAIGVRRPGSLEELRQCPGMGPTKLERYGDELLAVLDDTPRPEPAGP
ncbi:MAG: hypothetical protein NVS3B12_17490 [Acidimicrobiales bacterium]